jgi:hypothetical protein
VPQEQAVVVGVVIPVQRVHVPNCARRRARDVLLRRWRNLLGRTMWDFPSGRTGGNRYLVLGLGTGQAADLAVPRHRAEMKLRYPACRRDPILTFFASYPAPRSRLPKKSAEAYDRGHAVRSFERGRLR